MVEDIITARVVFEGGLAGAVNGVVNQGSSGKSERRKESKNFMPSWFKDLDKKTGGILSGVLKIAAPLYLIKKTLDKIVESSPKLQATLSIFKKTMELILRPIGDMISIFLRPMAIAFLRFAIPFYKRQIAELKTTGGKVGGVVGGIAGAAAGGAAGFAVGGPIGAAIGGIAGGIAGAFFGIDVGAKLEEWGKQLTAWFASIDWKALWGNISAFFTTYVIDPIKNFLSPFGDWFYENVFLPVLGIWATIVGWIDKNVVQPIKDFFAPIVDWFNTYIIEPVKTAWLSITTWFDEYIIQPVKDAWLTITTWFDENIIKPIKEAWKVITTWFDEYIIQPVKDAWLSITTWFSENVIAPIKNAWKTFSDWVGEKIEGIKSWWDKMKATGKETAEDINGGRQSGGYIPQSGKYMLHAGEFVVPKKQFGTLDFMPNITVNATVSSDIDINKLADKLSQVLYGNLKRQVSYGVF